MVRFVVERDGQVTEVTLLSGSGSSALDDAARALVQGARLPPFPPGMDEPRQSVVAPIRYRLD